MMTVREMMKEVGFPFVFDRCDDIIVFGDSKRIEEGEYELGSRFIEIREDGTVEAFEYDDEYGEKAITLTSLMMKAISQQLEEFASADSKIE